VSPEGFRKGAYIVSRDENPQAVLLASGSEVSSLETAAAVLRKEGYRLQVVSVPSEGRFREQDKAYQNEVLPPAVRRFGLTAGLPCTLEGLVGGNGSIWGMTSFGFSAPYQVLEEKLGFTTEHICQQIRQLIG
ncbi:MAG: transketolase, partial [Paludibacteraceae bacterium]|nr:transketolase [Paludibacteraceae bacterium]